MRIARQTGCSPTAVRQDYAKKITCYSNDGNPRPIIDEFKYDPLPIVAVSVDMLDTGYDHKEVENLLMLRPTKSAIKYAQMRGRGSRLCPRIGKKEFIVYDFVGNTKRFNDPGQPYHKPKIVGPRPGPEPGGPEGGEEEGPEPKPPPLPPPPGPREFKVIPEGSLEDEIRAREIILVGPEGLAIDRRTYREKWEETVTELRRTDPAIDRIFRGEELTEAEWDGLTRRLNSPEYYFDEDTLRRAFEQPTGSLSDFIRAALGMFRFPTREERIERVFNTWVAEHSESINPAQAQMLRLLQARVLTGEPISMRLFSQPPFSLWGGLVRMEQLFGRDRLVQIVDELNTLLAA
jgi:type I restriction enzyme R subunit